MKNWGDFFRRCTPRTASSIPWFTRYSASYRCAFSMTKRPFGGKVTASSEVDRCVKAHVRDTVESRCGRTNGFSWTELRWGMRNTQRDGARDGNETEMGGLHPRGEPDTFLFSHSCL